MEKYKFEIIRGGSVPDKPLSTDLTNAVEALTCEFYAVDLLAAQGFANELFKLWSDSKGVFAGAGKYIKTPVVLSHNYE